MCGCPLSIDNLLLLVLDQDTRVKYFNLNEAFTFK